MTIGIAGDTPGTTANPAVEQIGDGVTPSVKATVSQFHNADNQTLATTAQGLLTGGVAQAINAAGNIDRQRETGTDQQPCVGVFTGAAQFAQEVLATTTTTVAAGAGANGTVTINVANTTGFQAKGTLNFEPGTTRYEAATIISLVTNTSITVQFNATGALFTHTQPYTVQTFLFNQERDFSGEGPMAQGVGAAVAAEFESNSGGPPLTSGLASGYTLDADRNIQGKNNTQMAITSTTAGNTSVVFTNNPWTSGLIIGQPLILSATANSAAVEEVIVSKNNTPVTGAGPITVNVVNPVVNSGSAFAVFDIFGLGIPSAASPLGTEDTMIWLNNPTATDPKRPFSALNSAPGTPGAALVSSDGTKATYRYAAAAFTPVAAPTAFLVIQGSATKTIRIKRIKIGGVATAAGNMQAQIARWSTAGTLGSAVLTALTAGKHDINDAAATATVSTVGTANYTTQGTGNAVPLDADRIQFATVAAGNAFNVLTWDFSTRQDKALIVRGTTDFIVVSGNGSAVPAGGVLDITVETEEDAS